MLHIYFKVVQLPALVTVMIMPGLVSFGVAACCHGGVADQAVEDWVDHREDLNLNTVQPCCWDPWFVQPQENDVLYRVTGLWYEMILRPTPDRGGVQLARDGRQQQQYGDAVGVHAGCTWQSSNNICINCY